VRLDVLLLPFPTFERAEEGGHLSGSGPPRSYQTRSSSAYPNLGFPHIKDNFGLLINPSCNFQIRTKQEHQLKVRNFLPPQSGEPEIFLVAREAEARGDIIFDQDGRAMYADGTYVDELDGE